MRVSTLSSCVHAAAVYRELRDWLSARKITDTGCIEKDDLVARVSQSGYYNQECYVCLAEYAAGDRVKLLPCKHEFHSECIDKWLADVHRTCPLCRKDVCGEDDS